MTNSVVHRSKKTAVYLAAPFLVVATALLYAPVRSHEFLHFDDAAYVTDNEYVDSGLNRTNIAWAFTTFHEGNWHPVTWVSHMTDFEFFELNSGPHHLVNLALHAANVLLLFWLLQRGTGAIWRSFLVAALFAVHPLNVETVAWVAERKSLLSALFSLITIAFYGWYVRRPDWRRYLAVVVAFALALMSKPMAVSLPLVLLLLDYWPLKRYENSPPRVKWWRLSIEKVPLLLMSLASSVITMRAQVSGGWVGLSALPLSFRMKNALVSYAAYIRKTVWPANLAVLYPLRPLSRSSVAAATLAFVAVTIAILYFHRRRYLAVGWFLYVLTLIPVIGIVQVGAQAMADRYTYIPDIGLFILIVWGLSDIARTVALPRIVPVIAALCILSAFAFATARYLPYWRDGVTLLTRAETVAGQPHPAIEEVLADELASRDMVAQAYQHYGKACALLPTFETCHYNMAEILFSQNRLRESLAQYEAVRDLSPSKDMALYCLTRSGEILLDLGEYAAAETKLKAALQIDPNNGTALRLRERASRASH